MENRPKVGLGVLVFKNNKVLFGKRKNAHGNHTWALPGGHLEWMETFEECAKRETKEEAGIDIKHITFATITNDMFLQENKHYITIFVTSEWDSGKVRIMEPEKCDEWGWFSWNQLPAPLFLTIENLIKQGFKPNFSKNTII